MSANKTHIAGALVAVMTLLAGGAIPAQARDVQESFTCVGDNPGSQQVNVRIEGGHLIMGQNGDYGPVQETDTHYKASTEQPVLKDGRGSFKGSFDLDRTTGVFRLHIIAKAPSIGSGPLDINSLSYGKCAGFTPASSANEDNSESYSDDSRKVNEDTASRDEEDQAQEELEQSLEEARIGREEDRQEEMDRLAEEKEKQDLARAEKIEKERERLETERLQREEEARIAREEAIEADRKRKEEAEIARKKAEKDAKEKAANKIVMDEASIRGNFYGRAATCVGGGTGVLYLQTSTPKRMGCNVTFEARCPGTSSGNGVSFGQRNYVGGSCMGIGDLIKIGPMACPAEQVVVDLTDVDCG